MQIGSEMSRGLQTRLCLTTLSQAVPKIVLCLYGNRVKNMKMELVAGSQNFCARLTHLFGESVGRWLETCWPSQLATTKCRCGSNQSMSLGFRSRPLKTASATQRRLPEASRLLVLVWFVCKGIFVDDNFWQYLQFNKSKFKSTN